ncbi:MAG TPA: hypothetical protein VF665_21125 [Longimicrobium sp.]|jgi:hypothetical protein
MNKLALDLGSLAVESFPTANTAPGPDTTLIANSPLCGPSPIDSCATQC